MSAETPAFLAIGSNIDPDRNIGRCLDRLREVPETTVVSTSSWYRTAPWGIEAQPDFINLVAGLLTRLSPEALLSETQAIETRLGRVRQLCNGPRTIDLDILLFGDQQVSADTLQIPHPGLLIRDFMLIPLIEVAPWARHPERGRPVSELTQEIRIHQIIERLPATVARPRLDPPDPAREQAP